MATHKAGNDVDSWCGKCDMMLAHVVHALVGTRIARVECKTCHAVHAYKAHRPGEGPSRRRAGEKATRRTRTAAMPTPEFHFETLTKDRDLSQSTPFSLQTRFELDAVVKHGKFGLGLVTKVMEDKKIQVVFEDAVRILAHDRG